MEREMNIFEIIKALMKRYKILMVIVLIFGLLGSGISFLTNEKQYQSTASLIVGTETQKETDELNKITGEPIYEEVIEYGDSSISEQSKKFYSETLAREDLLKEVIDNLELDLSISELRNSISLEIPENSSTLYIMLRSNKVEEVDLILDEVVKVFQDKVYEITKKEKIKKLNDASQPIIKDDTNFVKNTAIAIIIGLGLSFIIILVLEYLDDSIDSTKIIEEKLNIPILGQLNSKDSLDEDIKQIRTKLEYSNRLKDKKIILYTSLSRTNEKVLINLSTALGAIERKTILVDTDFRNPKIHKQLSIPNKAGLSDYLADDSNISEILQNYKETVQVLTAGNSLENPSEKFSSIKMKKLLDDFRERFDYVLLNGSAIDEVTDSVILSIISDGIILLIEKDETKQSEIKKIQKTLDEVDVELLGVIFKDY